MEKMFASEGVTKSDRMLHTPGTFAKNHLLYVQEAGVLQSLTPHICKRKDLDSYLLFEVEKGRGTVTTEGVTYELQKGDCVLLDCHKEFEHISSEDKPWQLAWVHFNGCGAKVFYELFCERNQSPVFVPAESAKVSEQIRNLLEMVKQNGSELQMHAMLTSLIVSCVAQMDDKERMEDIREYVNVNYREQTLLGILSEKFHIQQEELDNVFQANYGIGIRDYILNRRFNAAKELLRFTIKPINEVIEESGIRNEDLFYQLFKENEAMTPEEYRRRWAQWIKD